MAISRTDARRNRAALLRAAREVFQADGADAPLDLVAKRAGVGRGTLYRHFPDRYALVAAVFEDALSEFEAFAEEHRTEPDVAIRLLVLMTSRQESLRGLFPLLSSAPAGHAHIRSLTERTRALLATHAATSRAAGVLDDWVTVDDLLHILVMIGSMVEATPSEQLHAVHERCLHIVLSGISTAPPNVSLPQAPAPLGD